MLKQYKRFIDPPLPVGLVAFGVSIAAERLCDEVLLLSFKTFRHFFVQKRKREVETRIKQQTGTSLVVCSVASDQRLVVMKHFYELRFL